MAKKIVLLVAILVIIPLAISGCLFKKDSDSLSEDNQQQEEQQEDFAGSVQDLINRGKASKCTYDFEDDGVKVDGVVYTAN